VKHCRFPIANCRFTHALQVQLIGKDKWQYSAVANGNNNRQLAIGNRQ